MASTQKLIAVVGGTGNLGTSVSLSLQDNPEFKVRALSRDPGSAKAQRLVAKGIEVVKADNWKADELLEAFKGCWGVFINIDSDAPNFKQQIGPSELEMGKIIIDAAQKAGIKHAVHASLLSATKLTNGEISVTSFDDKAATTEYAMQPGKFSTATAVGAGWWLENVFDPKYTAAFGGFAVIKDSEGYLTWATPPMGNDPESVPWLAMADDYGDFVHGVFLDPVKWNGKWVHGVSESSSFADLTKEYQKVTGNPARYKRLEKGGLPAADPFKKKEVNLLFDVMDAVKGNYFNGLPTNHEDARVLKAAAWRARGEKLQKKPMTLTDFFKKYAL